jgi:hypothetical protein
VTTFMLDAATAEHLMRHSRDSVSSVKPFNQDTLRRDAKALRQRIVSEAEAALARGHEEKITGCQGILQLRGRSYDG